MGTGEGASSRDGGSLSCRFTGVHCRDLIDEGLRRPSTKSLGVDQHGDGQFQWRFLKREGRLGGVVTSSSDPFRWSSGEGK